MSADVSPEARLALERRLRPRYAVLAGVVALLLLGASIIQSVGPHTTIDEATLDLIVANKRAGLDILAAVVTTLGSLTIAATLVFLLDCARARNPQVTPFVRWLTIVGALLAGISTLIYAVELSAKAHQFVSSGAQTYQQAHKLTSSGGLVILQFAGLLGALLVAMAIVLVSLQAMRMGLLSRFMGYIGMFAGALVLFQIFPVPVVEIYWFLALAVLFAGRWPNGEPAAWQTGRAERLPTAQELREQRIRAAGGQPGRPQRGGLFGRAGKAPEVKGNGAGAAALPASTPTRSSAAGKRKRKRRR